MVDKVDTTKLAFKVSGSDTMLEPPSPIDEDFPPDYKNSQLWESSSGHSLLMYDVKGRESVRLQHRSGTFFELHPDGKRVNKVFGDNYEIVIGDNQIYVSGLCKITVIGDAVIDCQKDLTMKVAKDFTMEVGGDFTQIVKGTTRLNSSGDTRITAGGILNPASTVTVNAPVSMQIEADVNINGGLTSKSVVSTGQINADGIITSGTSVVPIVDPTGNLSGSPGGFVTKYGGITIGVDGVAIPGTIRNMGSPLTGMLGHYIGTGTISAVLPISSATSMLAPLVLSGIVVGGYVRDAMGSMAGIRVEHNLHVHPATPTTGIPVPSMVGTFA